MISFRQMGKPRRHQDIRVRALVVLRKHCATSLLVQIREHLLKLTQKAVFSTFGALTFNLCLPNLFFLLENTLWPCVCQKCGLVLILLTDAQHNSNSFDALEFVLLLRTLHKETRRKTASSWVRPCFTSAIENAPWLMTVLF